jgi:hypothetical protein
MNIFHLSMCPKKSAKYLCDKHVSKMFTETGQMLSYAHFIHGSWMDGMCAPYSKAGKLLSHVKHPMTKWVAETEANYRWTYQLACGLMNEHWLRFHTTHNTMYRMHCFVDSPPNIPKGGLTRPPLCMPDAYHSDNHVASYRAYYCHEKSHFAKWVHCTPVPFWYEVMQSLQ